MRAEISMGDLVDLIYQASLERERWHEVTSSVGRVLGGAATLLVCDDGGISELGPWPGEWINGEQTHVAAWHDDRAVRRLRSAPVGTVIHSSQTSPPSAAGERGGTQSLPFRHGVHTVVGRVTRKAVILVLTGEGETREHWEDRFERLVGALQPHLERSLDLYGRLAAAEIERDASFAALDRAGVGFLVATANGAIRHTSDLAGARLSAAGLAMRQGKVVALDAGAYRGLQRALLDATRDDGAASVVCTSPDGEADGHGVTVVPLRGDEEPLALLLLPGDRAAPDSEHLRDSYGLTASEARLLGALVSGERLGAYAARAGVRVTTAKTHLRNVFCKTGERRQSDLVRRALTDPALRFCVAAPNA